MKQIACLNVAIVLAGAIIASGLAALLMLGGQ
jgi:hypothetical protein